MVVIQTAKAEPSARQERPFASPTVPGHGSVSDGLICYQVSQPMPSLFPLTEGVADAFDDAFSASFVSDSCQIPAGDVVALPWH